MQESILEQPASEKIASLHGPRSMAQTARTPSASRTLLCHHRDLAVISSSSRTMIGRAAGNLAGKIALVTGSTSGIGLGVAEALASHGANIILNGFGSPADIARISNHIQTKYNVAVDFQGADLSKVEAIEDMFRTLEEKKKNVDILVNNAGIQHVVPTEVFPVDKWNDIININLNAVFHTTRLALPSMQKKNFGRIINISSAHGTPFSFLLRYSS